MPFSILREHIKLDEKKLQWYDKGHLNLFHILGKSPSSKKMQGEPEPASAVSCLKESVLGF